MEYSYNTIREVSEGLFKDRGSKFISYAFPVYSEEDAKHIVMQLKKQYHDARHHCFGWRIGINPPSTRANDDGEPANSAGKPILNQIEKYNLTNILIVVIRYFGGTLLGVGGLINAYRTSAEEAIKNSVFIKKDLINTYELFFEYPLMNDVMKIVKEHNLETLNHKFEISCNLQCKMKVIEEQGILKQIKKLKGCKVKKL